MRAIATRRFERSYGDAPPAVQRATDKQLRLLVGNLRHPSLNAKKYPESGDPELWQGRITKGWRFYFKIAGDKPAEHVALPLRATGRDDRQRHVPDQRIRVEILGVARQCRFHSRASY